MKKVLATVLTLVIAVSAIPASSVKTDAATSTDNSSYIPPHVVSCDSGKYKFEKGIECGCNDCNDRKEILSRVDNFKNKTMQDVINEAAKVDEDKDYSKEWFFYSCPKGLSDDEVIEKFKESLVAEQIDAGYTAGGYDYSYFFKAIKEKKDILPHVKNKHYFAEYIRKFGILQVNEENTIGYNNTNLNCVAIVWFHSYLTNYQNDIEYAGLTNQQKIDRWWKENYDYDNLKLDILNYGLSPETPLKNVKATINDTSLVFNWSYDVPEKNEYYIISDKHKMSSDPRSLGFFIRISYDKNFKNTKDYFISLTDNKYVEIYEKSGGEYCFKWTKSDFSYTIKGIDTSKDIYYKVSLGQDGMRDYLPSAHYEKECPYFVGTEEEGNQIHWFNDSRPINGYGNYISTGVVTKKYSKTESGDNTFISDAKNNKTFKIKKPVIKKSPTKKAKKKSLTFKIKNAPKIKGYKTGYQIEVYTKKGKKKKKKVILSKNYSSSNKKFKKSGKSYKKVKLSNKKFKNVKKLYIRARYYVKVNGSTAYGQWSSAKKVKIKK